MGPPLRLALALLLCVGSLAASGETRAEKFLFSSRIDVEDGGQLRSNLAASNDIRKVGEGITPEGLSILFPDLADPSQVAADSTVNLRGVIVDLAFESSSNVLVVSIPTAGVRVIFGGSDRGESVDLFEDWLQGEYESAAATDDALTAFMQETVASSPVDPIAGNPGSLQTRMIEAAYFTGTTGAYRPRTGGPLAEEWTGKDHFRAQARYDYFRGGPWNGNIVEIGLDYQVNFRNPRFALLFDLPFVVSETQGAESYLVSAGIGLQWRPTHWWNLTPSVRMGGAGSFKLGAVAIMANVNLTSSMRWDIGSAKLTLGGRTLTTPKFELGLGNMFGWNGTFDDLEIGGYRIAYELDNYAIRNGIDLGRRFGRRIPGGVPSLKLYFTDTWMLGSRLFLDHYNELGLRFSTQRRTGGKWRDSFAFDCGWVFGDDYDALQLKLSYRF